MNQSMKENTKHRVRLSKVLLNLILSAAIIFGSMPCKPFVMEVKADTTTEKTITGLGLGTIMTKPNEPQDRYVFWEGSHVYFGKYAEKPMKYRVLACSENMILLDCDNILKDIQFSTNNNNNWKDSEVRSWLQGNDFYNNTDVFTAAEKNAIHAGNEEIEGIDDVTIPEDYTIVGLEDPDPVFVLNVSAVTNSRLGYYNNTDWSDTREKSFLDETASKRVDWWWLRSKGRDRIDNYDSVGTVYDYRVKALSVVDEWVGVSPALYLDTAPILYSSLVKGSEGQAGSEYKLTVKDEGLSVSYNNVEGEDGSISVSYTFEDNSGSADPTQISVVVTDGTWTGSGWSNGANLLQYDKLTVETLGTSGTGTFTLDPNPTGTFGQDYHVYILAEDVNGTYETDYASEPVELELKPSVQASAENVEVTYDGKPHGISVNIAGDTEGVTVKYGSRADDCTKELGDLAITNVSDSPREIFYEASKQGYRSASGSATVIINKVPLTVKAKDKTITYGEAPANEGVEYSGFVNSENESVLEGTLLYDYNYSQGGNAGSYTITPKGLTSDNYAISFETGTLTVEKANPVVAAPTAKEHLTYNGQAQELVNAGAATGGTMHYAVTTENTAPTDESLYATTIPTATNAGTYYVWYKVKGDANHNDAAAQKVPATISKADSGSDTASTVQVQKGDSVDASVNIRGYVGAGAKIKEGTVPQIQSADGASISISNFAVSDDGYDLKFKVTAQDEVSAEITAILSSDNYDSFILTIPVKVQAKTTGVKLDISGNSTTSVQKVDVTGLDKLTDDLTGNKVKVELDVKPVNAPSDETVKNKIEKVIEKIFSGVDNNKVTEEYLEISINQTVDGTESTATDVGSVIEIVVKYDLTGKYNPVVVREHGDSVKGFTPLASKPATGNYQDGTYFVENNTIHIYSRYFSTYTIAYTTVDSHTVTFDARGGNSVDSIVVQKGGTISTLPTTTRSGYTFNGWFTSASGGTQLTTLTTINDHITYYAHWTQDSSGGGDSGSGGSGDSGNSGGSGDSGSGSGSGTVTPPSTTLEIKQKQNISSYLGTIYKKYQYSQKGIVSISSKGIITAKKAGTVKVTGCVKQGKNWVASGSSVTLTVEKPYFAEKTLQASYAGQKLNAANNLKGVSQKPTSWQSSKSSVVSIDSDTGEITAVKGGSAKITAIFGSGSYAAKYSFTVKVNLPRISKKTATLITGGIVRLKVNNTKKPVTWSTDNSSIAAVSGTGEVTAKNAGQATITATVEGQKYDCTVTVRPPAIRKATMKIRAGRQARVGLKNTKLSAYQISWSSSDTSVARVDASGYVTGVAPGTAVISTTAGGATSSCTVTVR